MDPNQALDDLKIIREVMERTRRSVEGQGGWIMVLWGVIWFVGFLATQFWQAAGWLWLVLNAIGAVGTILLIVRMERGERVRSSSPVWRLIALWWLALVVFDVLIVWLFDIRVNPNLLLLIFLTIALGYFQFGLFTHWIFAITGLLIGATAVAAIVWLPDYFYLVIAVAGGGGLFGSGLWLACHKHRN